MIKTLGTLIGATIGAYLAGSTFFVDFTNHKNWESGDRFSVITKYDSGWSSASGAAIGGGLGFIVGLIGDRYTKTRRVKGIRAYLLNLRESSELGDAEREAIDLTLANLQNREPSANRNNAPTL